MRLGKEMALDRLTFYIFGCLMGTFTTILMTRFGLGWRTLLLSCIGLVSYLVLDWACAKKLGELNERS